MDARKLLFTTATALPAAAVAGNNDTLTPAAAGWSHGVKALLFDVFGTVVDWRTSIIREATLLGKVKGIEADWTKFADQWRAGYAPAMARVRNKEIPWTNMDRLHRMILDDLIPKFGLEELSEAERTHLNQVWHRLIPWPDAVAGLTRLRQRYITGTLSNGNVTLLANMAKNVGLPWDCVLSAEMSQHYKPDREAYQTPVRLLGLDIREVIFVAAHAGDIAGAKRAGLKTAFVPRPLEFGPSRDADSPPPEADMTAADFIDLALKVGA